MASLPDLLIGLRQGNPRAIARAISIVEDNDEAAGEILASLDESLVAKATVLGITGPPGAGKSTLTSQLISYYRQQHTRVGIIAIDPSSPLSGGAILGDRIRMMEHALDLDVVVRSMATRGRLGGLCSAAGSAVRIMAASGCAMIIIETVGVGQSEMDVMHLADITALVLAPGLGDDIQAMKAGLLEVADLLVVNKADCSGVEMLVMDMEAVARERRTGSETMVCRTVASEGKGIVELAGMIAKLDERFRQTAEFKRRRGQSLHMEILDWAVELLRPQLRSSLSELDLSDPREPRILAQRLLEIYKSSRHR